MRCGGRRDRGGGARLPTCEGRTGARGASRPLGNDVGLISDQSDPGGGACSELSTGFPDVGTVGSGRDLTAAQPGDRGRNRGPPVQESKAAGLGRALLGRSRDT